MWALFPSRLSSVWGRDAVALTLSAGADLSVRRKRAMSRISPDGRAMLLIAGVAAREGIESWRGEACCDTC